MTIGFSMPSSETKEDPRLVELAAVNTRLKAVLAFLKTRHTSDSLDAMLETAATGVGDMTPSFVKIDGSTLVPGTRHMESLLRMTEAMEIQAEIGRADHAIEECTLLLERKVELLRELSGGKGPAARNLKRIRS